MRIAEAYVDIRVRSDQAKKEARDQARGTANEVTKTFAQYFSAAVVVKELRKMTDAASNLEQAVGGTEAIFGAARRSIDEFAQTSADAVGLSERAFRELSSQIGGLLGGLGFTQEAAADTSISLVKLGADLAATFGGRPEEAVQALGAALRGEFNPLERFGVSLRVSTINLKAVELGLAEATSKVSDNARAQAALALITEQSANAQGQFGREASTAAGKQARFTAELENQRAEIGEALLPVYGAVLDSIGLLLEGFGAIPAPAQTAIVAMIGIAAIAGPASKAASAFVDLRKVIQQMPPAARVMTGALGAAGVALVAYQIHNQRAAQHTQDVIDKATELGRVADEQLGRVFTEAVLSGTLAGQSLDETMENLARTNLEGAKRTLEYAEATGVSEEHIDRLRDAIEEEEEARARQEETTAKYAEAEEEATDATTRSADSLARQDEFIREVNQSLGKVERQLERKARADEEAKAAADAHREAMEALFESVNANIAGAFSYEEATLRLDNAVSDYQVKLWETVEAERAGELSGRELTKAKNGLRLEEISLAESALETARAFADQQGAQEGTEEHAGIMRQKLQELAGQFPFLRDEIDAYIAELDRIPRSVDSVLRLNIAGRTVTVGQNGAGGTISASGFRAHGGPVAGGRIYEVLERGQSEILTEGGRRYLLSARDGDVTPIGSDSRLLDVLGELTGASGGSTMPVESSSTTVNVYPRGDVDVGDVARALEMARLSR